MQILRIDGEIGWDTTAKEFKQTLKETTGDITLEISSPGGHVFQGVEIFNALKAYNKGKITAVISSLAASMASYIALAADEVQAYDNSTYMIHNASAIAWGDHRALRKKADIVNGLSVVLAKAYIAKTGKSEQEIQKMMDDETYLYGQEMKDAGFVDVILSTEDEKNAMSAKALSSESVSACLKDANTRYSDEDYTTAAALLSNLEEPTPSKEGNTEVEGEDNSSRVNAIRARLNLKEKELNHE